MSEKRWTQEQLAAITTRDKNLLVAAAAGAGKTAVLVERIIGIITDPQQPVEVDRLLVVTFTNAAAAEMRERIGAALTAELNRNPRSKHLARQVVLLNRASVTTIHSFCLELLRRYFYKLDLDPAFRIADEVEAELLRLDVLEELFEQRYAGDDSTAFTTLVEVYGGQRDDAKLQDLVLELYRFSSSHPWPEYWLGGLADAFDLPEDQEVEQLPWVKIIQKQITGDMSSALAMLEQAMLLAKKPGGPEPYSQNLAEDQRMVEELRDRCSGGWQQMYRAFSAVQWSRLRPCKGEYDEGLKERVQSLRNGVKDKIKAITSTYFCAEPAELFKDIRALVPLIRELSSLTIAFREAYRQKKRTKGLVDFGDLEHFCLAILMDSQSKPGQVIPSPVALELREHFSEVLVDEYQDINGVQETILQLVARPNNLFMVGDVKQSIYGFRLAEPELFLAKYHRYSTRENETECRIDLTSNFRSRSGVVGAVNFIFRQIMTRETGGVSYDAAAELRYGANFPPVEDHWQVDGPVELHLVDRREPEGEESPFSGSAGEVETETRTGDPEELDTDQAEARLVGKRIMELVQGFDMEEPLQIWDKDTGTYRPVRYRDMVILLRATTGRANTFLEELRALGIPTYAELGTGYFEAIEVETFLSLLKIIDNPRQDVPLAAVLRSPMVGLKASDLAEVRLCGGEGDFYQAVQQAALKDLGPLSGTLSDFLARLEKWRSQARRGSLAELIWLLYGETGYYDYVGGMVGGNQRQANLRVLYHRAKQYESTSFRGLFRFLRFVERIRDTGSDLGSARTLGEKEDVVRILSIHKSKGLEFPVVFVAGLGKQFNLTDLNKDVLMHKSLGLGPQIVNTETRVSYPSLLKLMIKEQIKREAVAEEMRILYVALTRARERLLLIGSVRDLARSAQRWCAPAQQEGWQLPETELLHAKTCLDWICPAVARHRDGRELLQLSGVETPPPREVAMDLSNWALIRWNLAELQRQASEKQRAIEPWLEKVRRLEPLEDGGQSEEVSRRLSWRYTWSEVTSKIAKVAVTEIKRRFDNLAQQNEDAAAHRPRLAGRPKFLQQKRGLTGAERGSALHTVMQHIDLREAPDIQKVEDLLRIMVTREILLPEQAQAVDPNTIVRFFQSTLGERVLQAKGVSRELPFTLALPATEVYPDLSERGKDERVLVQGVIDCLVDEGDGLLLIDYKSDRIPPGQLPVVAERYRGQINLYSRAVEEILKRPVKERVIYLFDNGEILTL